MQPQALTMRSVEVRPVLLPLRRPVVSRVGGFERWPLILVDLQTEEGVVGRSYLEPYLERAVHYLGPAIVDLVDRFRGAPIGPLDLFERARASLSLLGLEGMALAAVSALDMALWDALARAAGVPLAVLLGGTPGPVSAYNSNGLWLTPPQGQGDEAAELVAEGGFQGLKLRLGRERLAEDLDALRRVRAAAGDGLLLMVDFNQGLTFDRALRRLQELDAEGLYWFEEPVSYDDWAGHAALRRRLRTPLQLGENFWGPRDAQKALAAGAADYVMPDLMRIGGVTGWLRTAAIAGAAGVPVSSHLYPEFSAHLLRVTQTAHWLEWQDWADPVVAEPFPVRDGRLTVPDRPGAGLEWDEDAVARFRQEV
ncbi:MAG: mandelate racemase [Candidatus Dormibacteraeota bacterium]|nr:mandelate racemase [Candidatus Dormibacteraeota bacterium]MBO0761466.1 mandelate racemase [Candidatus Dormibacteraeota bacterium]